MEHILYYADYGILIVRYLRQGRASDDKHADRKAKQAEQQRTDMMDSKKCAFLSWSVRGLNLKLVPLIALI